MSAVGWAAAAAVWQPRLGVWGEMRSCTAWATFGLPACFGAKPTLGLCMHAWCIVTAPIPN